MWFLALYIFTRLFWRAREALVKQPWGGCIIPFHIMRDRYHNIMSFRSLAHWPLHKMAVIFKSIFLIENFCILIKQVAFPKPMTIQLSDPYKYILPVTKAMDHSSGRQLSQVPTIFWRYLLDRGKVGFSFIIYYFNFWWKYPCSEKF